MDSQEQLVNEILKLLPELARAQLSMTSDDGRRLHGNEQELLHNHGFSSENIPAGQSKLALHLALYGPQSMSELARGLDVSTPAVTGLVDKLEERGLVERVRTATDRRTIIVRLTPEALEMARGMLEERSKRIRIVLAQLEPSEQQAFVRTLKALTLALS